MTAPTLREADVRQRVGDASFGRARPYVSALDARRRQGDTLRATCHGSLPEPYAVRATLDAEGVAEARCSCPVGAEGRCKHVAALLLRWIAEPAAFPEAETLDAALARLGEAELRDAIRRMVAHRPDLEAVVVPPPAGTGPSAGALRRQVRRILEGGPWDWGDAMAAGQELERIVLQADAAALRGDWRAVVDVCGAVLDGVLAAEDWLHDESGTVVGVVGDCARAVGQGLERAADPDLRIALADLLYDVLGADAQLGGIGMGDGPEADLRAHATGPERAALCARIARDLDVSARADGWGAGWYRRQLGELWAALQPDDLDDGEYLAFCDASGLHEAAVRRLVARGRVDEAAEVARKVDDLAFLALTHHFEPAHAAVAEALALERLTAHSDERLVSWIQRRARDRGDGELALSLAERLAESRPSAERYQDAVALAEGLDRGDATRARLKAAFLDQKAYAALTRAHLLDDDLDDALRLVYLPATDWRGARAALRLEVADGVWRVRPEEALQLYLEAAVDHVEQRGRDHYAQAAHLLTKARAVYRHRGRTDDWALLIAELRDGYRALRAFQNELDKAGL